VISPLLANIYLHYCFDLWAERWMRCATDLGSSHCHSTRTRPA
jgi:retron-type reverse transcriptase